MFSGQPRVLVERWPGLGGDRVPRTDRVKTGRRLPRLQPGMLLRSRDVFNMLYHVSSGDGIRYFDKDEQVLVVAVGAVTPREVITVLTSKGEFGRVRVWTINDDLFDVISA